MDSKSTHSENPRPTSRVWSESSRRSENVQELRAASEEIRRANLQKAKIKAEKNKLDAEFKKAAARRAARRTAEEIEEEADMDLQRAAMQEELDAAEEDSRHAMRMMEIISETLGTETSSGENVRDFHVDAATTSRVSRWAEYQNPAAETSPEPWEGTRAEEDGDAALETARRRGDGGRPETSDATARGAARGAATAGGPALGAATADGTARGAATAGGAALGAATADGPERGAADAGDSRSGSAAALKVAADTDQGTSSDGISSASEKIVKEVCRIFSVASTKPHYAKELLPQFHGDPLEFVAFKAIFKQSTDVMHLTDAQNLLRLQNALKGRAREAVTGLLLSPENVADIMTTLEALFGNTNLIIQRTIADLRKDKGLSDSLDADGLMRFACQIKNLVATVKSVNRLEHLHNPDLLASLVAKLPKNLLTLWLADRGRAGLDDPVLVYFALWLERLAISAQDAGLYVTEPHRKSYDSARDRKQRETGSKKYILHTQSKEEPKCPRCEKSHYLNKCEEFKNLPLVGRWDEIKKMRRCFKCLGLNHSQKSCPAYKKFPKGKYHYLLTATAPAKEAEVGAPARASSEVVASAVSQNQVILQVLPITVVGPNGKKVLYALLDAGATVSLIDQSVAKELGIRGPTQTLQLSGIGQMKESNNSAEAVSFTVKGDLNKKKYAVRAYSVTSLNLPEVKSVISDLAPIRGMVRSTLVTAVKPHLLLGANCWELIVSRGLKTIEGDLSVSKTLLGWVAIGGRDMIARETGYPALCLKQETEPSVDRLLEASLKLEYDWPNKKRKIQTDIRAEQILEETTSFKNGIWETGLLWKEGDVSISDNREMAMTRLKSLERKMDSDRYYGDRYCQQIERYLAEGYASKVEEHQLRNHPRLLFLPHMGVVHPAKQDKIRIVHDAASIGAGGSLNSRLLGGPDYLNSILGILLRFRENAIAFTADIRDMYLRIKVREEDSFSQLFLWRDFQRDCPPKILKMDCLIFGSSSSPASALYVRNKNAARFKNQYPTAVKIVERDTYMDDLLSGADTLEEAKQIIKEINLIHKAGNFTMSSWASNKNEALSEIPEEHCARAQVALERGEMSSQRILGLTWLPASDQLVFNVSLDRICEELTTGDKIPSKREALKIIMSIWDPIGALSPLTIRAKLIMQQIWSSQVAWDNEISGDIIKHWRRWLLELKLAQGVRIARYNGATRQTDERRHLHVFSDASEKAMCAVAYVTITEGCGAPKVSFVSSKTRVAPLNGKLTVPRLELTAALLGAELAAKIKQESALSFDEVFMWTDSKNVWWWIRSPKECHLQFVANRLGMIDELTAPKDWHWLSGRDNPADDGTRNTTKLDLSPQGRWFAGPTFLHGSREHWPLQEPTDLKPEERAMLEFKTKIVLTITAKSEEMVDIGRFSQYMRANRTMAYVLKFIYLCKKKTESKALESCDISTGKKLMIKESQSRVFAHDTDLIRRQKILPKNSRLFGLNAYIDCDGLVRLGGRIENAKDTPFDTKRPYILHGKDRYTVLLVKYLHEVNGHGGTELILSVLREQFWVIGARQTVKKIARECVYCTIRRAKPLTAQMGQLPPARITAHKRCFHTTGLDACGPFFVTNRKKVEKRYALLFTCFSTRATHIELAGDLSTSSALLAIRRFIAARGKPKEIMSDNGCGFRGADAELRKILSEVDNEEIRNRLSADEIKWSFTPPAGPHFGGVWESQIKTAKKSLYAILKERAPNEDVLRTLLCEVAAMMNLRPLSYISLDSRDEKPLTPADFLLGYADDSTAVGQITTTKLYNQNHWKQSQILADAFWTRWAKEVLPLLVKRPKWATKKTPLEIGDLVVVLDPSLERGRWARARVTTVFPDKTGQVRIVELLINGKIYRRPVSKLVKIHTTADDAETAVTDG